MGTASEGRVTLVLRAVPVVRPSTCFLHFPQSAIIARSTYSCLAATCCGLVNDVYLLLNIRVRCDVGACAAVLGSVASLPL